MRFGRKKGEQEEVVSGDVVPEAADPSAWTFPPDAEVAADAEQEDTVDIEAVAPATAAGRASRTDDQAGDVAGEGAAGPGATAEQPATSVSGASLTSPGLGSTAPPAAAAAANAPEPERPAAGDRSLPHAQPAEGPLAPILSNPAVQKKPELLVVGGLAAGFVFAKILNAITSGDK